MNAKKLSLTLSAVVLGLTSCGGGSSITRQEAYAKLDAIVAATPAAQTKLTSVYNTMEDVTAEDGTVTKAGVLTTYVFDADKLYSHVTFGAARTIGTLTFAAGDELYAYQGVNNYVLGVKSGSTSYKVTIPSTDAIKYAAVNTIMTSFAQNQIDAFIKCGREHWHNGAGGLSAYLKRQDTLDKNKVAVEVTSGQTIEAGATENGSHIVLENEKYTSTGEGNVVLDFDALYPVKGNPAKLHEPLKYEFNNNLLTHWYNKKSSNYAGNEWTMNYGTAAAAECTFEEDSSKATEAIANVTVSIAACVASDQSTATKDLYPAHWGN